MQKRQMKLSNFAYSTHLKLAFQTSDLYFILKVKLNNYSLQYMLSHNEYVGLFPWTEESHLERCDSLMELCTVSAGRDSNSALR